MTKLTNEQLLLLKQLKTMINQLPDQDNAITANPIFMVQDAYQQHVGDDYADYHVWLNTEQEHRTPTGEREFHLLRLAEEQRQKQYEETYTYDPDLITLPLEEDEEFNFSEWTLIGMIDVWINKQPFFTRKEANAHIAANKHRFARPRVYVESAYRNYEWQAVRLLLSLPQFESFLDTTIKSP